MRVYIYDKRYPKKGKHFWTLKEMREYVYGLYLEGLDHGVFKGRVDIRESGGDKVAKAVYGKHGEVKYPV